MTTATIRDIDGVKLVHGAIKAAVRTSPNHDVERPCSRKRANWRTSTTSSDEKQNPPPKPTNAQEEKQFFVELVGKEHIDERTKTAEKVS
jgi:hypothetical protein